MDLIPIRFRQFRRHFRSFTVQKLALSPRSSRGRSRRRLKEECLLACMMKGVSVFLAFCMFLGCGFLSGNPNRDSKEVISANRIEQNKEQEMKNFCRNKPSRSILQGDQDEKRQVCKECGSRDPWEAEQPGNVDYEPSDPPPVEKRPTKKPVQYRIFRLPPAASPPSSPS